MTKLVFSGRVTIDKDSNGLPVPKAMMVMVQDGQAAQAEALVNTFKSAAKDTRVRGGVPMGLSAIETRIEQLKGVAGQEETVWHLDKAKKALAAKM